MSRDYHWYSPVLKARLQDVVADLMVTPRDEAELVELMRYCVRRRLTLTPRGGGTGNYGQAMPVEGGVLLDCSRLDTIHWIRDGAVRAGAGALLKSIEDAALGSGLELRFHPSTVKMATIGGFVGGGTTGAGAINYGTLHDAGNLLGLRILSAEDEPRFIELRGADLAKAIHAYGTTGIITEVELALAPAQAWREFIVGFGTLRGALEASWAVAHADGLGKKELAVVDWEGARYFDSLRSRLTPGQALLIASIAPPSCEAFRRMVAEAGGAIVFERGPGEAEAGEGEDGDVPPIHEFCWNHTTLQALKHDRNITYLQVTFPKTDTLETILRMDAALAPEAITHVEVMRLGGEIRYSGLQLIHYRDEARLNEIIETLRANDCPVRDPHTFTLDRGPANGVNPVQARFKSVTDPYGLLNPGKMPGWTPRD
jgi:FAD/FMN-containing dehydrogenase